MANIVETSPAKQGALVGRQGLINKMSHNPIGKRRRARRDLERIYRAAVAAALPPLVLEKSVKISAGALIAGTGRARRRFALSGKIYLIGVGKGADLSAPFWSRLLGGRLERGIFIVRDRGVRRRFRRMAFHVAGHPVPDRRGLDATRELLRMLESAGRGDSVVFFLMGGASSLLVAPADGLILSHKRAATGAMLKSGMSIGEMNSVRKHLSRVKGGGLLRAAYPARVLTLAVSDVIGDDPSVIGSGPSFPDPTTFRDAWSIVKRYRLGGKIPAAVKRRLRRGVRGEIPETLKPGRALLRRNPFVVLANNRGALAAARRRAEALGYAATVVTAGLSGDAATRARELARKLKARAKKPPGAGRRCFLFGGETTVRVTGKGMGGRNQEFALAAAEELAGSRGIYLLAAASDGSDGPTDAAGAFIDGGTTRRARGLKLDPRRALKNNDSYRFFRRLGDLYRPGPTGTNVSDFVIALQDEARLGRRGPPRKKPRPGPGAVRRKLKI